MAVLYLGIIPNTEIRSVRPLSVFSVFVKILFNYLFVVPFYPYKRASDSTSWLLEAVFTRYMNSVIICFCVTFKKKMFFSDW